MATAPNIPAEPRRTTLSFIRDALGYVPSRVLKKSTTPGGSSGNIVVTGGPGNTVIDLSPAASAALLMVGAGMTLDFDPGEGLVIPGPPGSAGAAGTSGVSGAVLFVGIDGDEGPEGMPIPGAVGPAGPSGALALVYQDGTVPAGNTIANVGTITAFGSAYTIPAASLVIGNVIRVKLYGIYSTALTPPTITLAIKLGATVMLTTGAITAINSLTNDGWWAEALMTVTATGASGTIEAQGFACFATAATAAQNVDMTNTAVIGSIDTTASLALTANITWGTAATANTIQLREMTVEVMAVGAGGAGSGPVLLGEVIASGTPASMTVSSLPPTGYRHLLVEFLGFDTTVAGTVIMRFNGDSANHYANQFIQGFNGAASANGGVPQSGIAVVGNMGTVANVYAATSTINIPYYAQTTLPKSATATSFGMNSATLMVTHTEGGGWNSTAAITSVTLVAGTAHANGNRMSVYGII